MIEFFASIFGYVLNFIYELVKNYGLAMILFSILLKLVLLPLSIKQQKTMKKSMKIQEETKQIQEKYKGNQEKINQEMMDLYKRENASPFSGCLSAIIQFVLLISIFYLVRNPLTYMVKIEPDTLESYVTEVKQAAEAEENNHSLSYPEIAVIRNAREAINNNEVEDDKKELYDKMAINMNFIGLDLSNVPLQDMSNPTVFIIPVLYVISSFVTIRLTGNMTKKKEETDGKEADPMANANKSMMWFMPLMSISIALIAPLGLALYWLVNNLLMLAERLIMNHFFNNKEDEEKA